MMTEKYHKYINRELSWIEFNRRVLEEAQDENTPLLERCKFLAIVSSNLDEFVSVRVAGIKDRIRAGLVKKDFSGFTPLGLLKRVMRRTKRLVSDQYRTYREVVRLLAKERIFITAYKDLTDEQKQAVDKYYHEIVYPVLTPMAVDQSRPFPLVHSLGLYMALLLESHDEAHAEPFFATIQVPSILSRMVQAPQRPGSKKLEFIFLEDLIQQHIGTLFYGYKPIAVSAFRITRNADLTLNEEGAEDLLEEIEKELKKRRWGQPVRLEVQHNIHPLALEILQDEFEVDDSSILKIEGPLDLTFLAKFQGQLPGKEYLRYPKIEPVYPAEFADCEDMFAVLRQKDVLINLPYESFEAVDDFITQAAVDPQVLAIKMTLYRVSGNSIIVQSLAKAAEMGKQVTVVVELKARFDEQRNIVWARTLEQAGCHVVYGLVGLKTHAKLLMVVRKENNELRRYVHIGTGNYNGTTARLYTDVGLFTSHPTIGEDVSTVFNEITGYASPRNWQAISVAPTDMRPKLFALIAREKEMAAQGKYARIIAKMNSLSHQEMVDELYAASQAGVQVDLIVRGICCLRPGVPGLSENIRVISIVDRFLEHSRIFYFENAGDPDVFISSADWMTRNLTRRIECMTPILDKQIKTMLVNLLLLNLQDNVKARELRPDGSYVPVKQLRDEDLLPMRSQIEAMEISLWKLYA